MSVLTVFVVNISDFILLKNLSWHTMFYFWKFTRCTLPFNSLTSCLAWFALCLMWLSSVSIKNRPNKYCLRFRKATSGMLRNRVVAQLVDTWALSRTPAISSGYRIVAMAVPVDSRGKLLCSLVVQQWIPLYLFLRMAAGWRTVAVVLSFTILWTLYRHSISPTSLMLCRWVPIMFLGNFNCPLLSLSEWFHLFTRLWLQNSAILSFLFCC